MHRTACVRVLRHAWYLACCWVTTVESTVIWTMAGDCNYSRRYVTWPFKWHFVYCANFSVQLEGTRVETIRIEWIQLTVTKSIWRDIISQCRSSNISGEVTRPGAVRMGQDYLIVLKRLWSVIRLTESAVKIWVALPAQFWNMCFEFAIRARGWQVDTSVSCQTWSALNSATFTPAAASTACDRRVTDSTTR